MIQQIKIFELILLMIINLNDNNILYRVDCYVIVFVEFYLLYPYRINIHSKICSLLTLQIL